VCPKCFDRCGVPAPFWPFHCASRLVSRELREEPRSRPCATLGGPLACLHLIILFEPRGGPLGDVDTTFQNLAPTGFKCEACQIQTLKTSAWPRRAPPTGFGVARRSPGGFKGKKGRPQPSRAPNEENRHCRGLLVEHRPKCGGPTLPFTGQRPVGTPVPLCYRATAAPLIY